ncbi:hypothetical protein [Algibacter lectus]|uniref:hypothetical protein n=1 Tax=Algibacter lectus TaxID=221126 RepID=UPI0024951348|nr:hypothetical protein [Algibacter lectus]
MPLDKPYFRITRPFTSATDGRSSKYMISTQYANDRFVSIKAFHLLLSDLIKLFDYVEPSRQNTQTYSHRIYELILRAATEFESNCRAILSANDYPEDRYLNIKDFFKINKASKLNEYKVIFNAWSPTPLVLTPFSEWNTSEYKSLSWYQNYNSIKHNRSANFHNANLENLMNSISAVFIILYSQFEVLTFDPYQIVKQYSIDDNDHYISTRSSLFRIKPPRWQDNESYEFDWSSLSLDSNSINKYPF